jgi:hypothetical protein
MNGILGSSLLSPSSNLCRMNGILGSSLLSPSSHTCVDVSLIRETSTSVSLIRETKMNVMLIEIQFQIPVWIEEARSFLSPTSIDFVSTGFPITTVTCPGHIGCINDEKLWLVIFSVPINATGWIFVQESFHPVRPTNRKLGCTPQSIWKRQSSSKVIRKRWQGCRMLKHGLKSLNNHLKKSVWSTRIGRIVPI